MSAFDPKQYKISQLAHLYRDNNRTTFITPCAQRPIINWRVDISKESPLFRRAAGKEKPYLPHPTSSKFNPTLWKAALSKLEKPRLQDQRLTTSAIWCGMQLASLRPHLEKMMDGLSRTLAIQMMVAQANSQFRVLSRKMDRALKTASRKADSGNVEMLVDLPILTRQEGQRANVDSHLESLIDTLPHWFFHAVALPQNAAVASEDQLPRKAAALLAATSVERTYRDLWQEALWMGAHLDKVHNELTQVPFDRGQAEMWQSWVIRENSLKVQAGFLNRVALHGREAPTPDARPVLERSIIGIETRTGKRRVPVTGRLPTWGQKQKSHYFDWVVLENSYLASFLHEPLPHLRDAGLSIAILFKVWCVLGDLAEVLIGYLPRPRLSSHEIMRQYALSFRKDLLAETVGQVIGISKAAALSAVDFLCIGVDDNNRLFNRGFWSSPLVAAPSGNQIYMISPVLLYGNLLRAAEAWLERGGATTGLTPKGLRFERTVREQLQAKLATNELLSDADCPQEGLPTERDGEEIDGLLSIGSTVLLLEAKCFISPGEPIDQYNLMRKLCDAGLQAKRKAEWLEQHRDAIIRAFGWDGDRAAEAAIQPVVVINQSFGLGFVAKGVPVVDLHYLRLICGAGSYLADTAVRTADGFSLSSEVYLYSSQADLEQNITELLFDPAPMRRFRGKFSWSRQPIPAAPDVDFGVMLSALSEAPMATEDQDILRALIEKGV